ncbi:glycosyltransferase family 2 protein [Alteromonas aestuariivivens]|uniref:Glycosyltransferase family 2 protein n=1 Tax=Alteromonas aestuariivivens TaxID=1938339 RepID=A0A3D8MDA9_9ALTE|nr:glycosyltransferase family 2 protein [Alteromonas aestuariivivens]RDV28163.1 glycosyltransferase family 2 protein [Alteromonas aestuariivivens]
MKISVVITTCNRPDYLRESVASVLSQTRPADEILIVDDASVRSYEQVLAELDATRVRYAKLPQSGGANRARNYGIEHTSGDVVTFLDDDDAWLPEYLMQVERQYEQGADAVVTGYKRMGDEDISCVYPGKWVTREALQRGNPYCGMSGFSATRVCLQGLMFDEALLNGQDWDMYVRIYCAGCCFVNISRPLFLYRFQNLDGIGAKLRSMSVSQIESRFKSAIKHKAFLGDYFYRKRICEQILINLKYKKNRLSWVRKSLETVGLFHTARFFIDRLGSR